MRVLLDTHLVIWWEAKHPRLPAIVTQWVRNEAEVVFISRASLWEIAIKVSNGRLKMDIAKFAGKVEKHGFTWLDIKNEHLLAVAALPVFDDHRDLTGAIAQADRAARAARLIRLARYGLRCDGLNFGSMKLTADTCRSRPGNLSLWQESNQRTRCPALRAPLAQTAWPAANSPAAQTSGLPRLAVLRSAGQREGKSNSPPQFQSGILQNYEREFPVSATSSFTTGLLLGSQFTLEQLIAEYEGFLYV